MANEKYIQELVERDKPYPMGKFTFPSGSLKGTQVDTCGNCDRPTTGEFVFCPYCGQRIDHTLYKL